MASLSRFIIQKYGDKLRWLTFDMATYQDYDYQHGNPGAHESGGFMDQPGYGDEEENSYQPHDLSQKRRELLSIKSRIHTHLAHYDEADNRMG